MSKLLLIRHAQASFLAQDYDNLSDKGLVQSRLLGEYLVETGERFDQIYVGPLRRQKQTYQVVKEVYEENGIFFPTAIELEELDEYRGMDTMGVVRKQLMAHHPNFRLWFEEMDTQPSHKTKMKMVVTYLNMWATETLGFDLPDDCQKWSDFKGIAEVGLQKMIKGNDNGQSVAAFSSGGCIAAMLGRIVGTEDAGKAMGFNLVMLNTAIHEVLFSAERLSLKSFNSLPHLSKEMVTTM